MAEATYWLGVHPLYREPALGGSTTSVGESSRDVPTCSAALADVRTALGVAHTLGLAPSKQQLHCHVAALMDLSLLQATQSKRHVPGTFPVVHAELSF